ncbi:MAG TPA: ATP-dependent helicase HrpB, partial [Gammaproteobacteria bacterium]|nr:ATP-dependent helicase HrpB [Gammaproteobacteria bacterium]
MLPEISRLLAERGALVLQAEPGAGKTTRVPPALLAAPWLAKRRILVLEPRRLAAIMAARRMAAERGEVVGETIGYRVRLDQCIGPRTRIEVVTNGVFTRLIQSDPALEDYGF